MSEEEKAEDASEAAENPIDPGGPVDEPDEDSSPAVTDENLWRRYMDRYVEREKKLEAEDRMHLRQAADLPNLPRVESEAEFPAKGYPVNIFNQGEAAKLPDRLRPEEKVHVWKRMKENPPVDMSCFISEELPTVSKTDSGRWPGVCPCKKPVPKMKKKKFGERCIDSNPDEDEPEEDFADRLELWHARIPPTCPSARSNPPMVDRAAGLNHSLVSGDYVLTETVSKKKGNRVYANICLRGLAGMHLHELSALRARERTWKWCFYQAVVALLVKTQLRYKHTWSGNIDYIYDRGWNLFTHIGSINLKTVGTQKFDDVGVYNYTYDVEVELVQEMKDVPRAEGIPWDFVEANHGRVTEVERKDLVKFETKIGTERTKDEQTAPVHRATNRIEKWFDELPFQCQNCIFRTTRYCLAFWKEGPFWYLYNPYRCDDLGFWDDQGTACIVKFCSRNALKRHLMVLLLRAYAYSLPKPEADEAEADEAEADSEKKDVFTVQIFQMIYTRCELRNEKLLERRTPKPPMRPVENRIVETCPVWCESTYGDFTNVENPGWLKLLKVTWTRADASSKRIVRENIVTEKLRWHQFYVEEPHKLFSLWGDIHPSQSLFPVEHRGKQTYACYVVCAGMTRINAPEYWTPKTLDAVVMCGDKHYTISSIEAELKAKRPEYSDVETWGRYLAKNFRIGETVFRGELLPGTTGRLYSRSENCLWKTLQDMFLRHPFGIVTCESTCVAVFKFCGAYYMCDARSTGPPIFQYGGGVIYLIRTTCFSKLMKVLTVTIASTECSEFEVNPIQIFNAIDVGPATCFEGKMPKGLAKVSCPREGDRRSKKAKKKPRKKTIDQSSCKGQESPCDAAGRTKP